MTFNPPTETNPPFTTPPTWPSPTSSADWEPDYRLRLLEAAVIWLWTHSGGGGVTPPVVLQGTTNTVPLTVIGASGQTADLFDVETFGGASTPFFVAGNGAVGTPLVTLDDGAGNMGVSNNLTVSNNLIVTGNVNLPHTGQVYPTLTIRLSNANYSPAAGEVTYFATTSGSTTPTWTLPPVGQAIDRTINTIIHAGIPSNVISLVPPVGVNLFTQGGTSVASFTILSGMVVDVMFNATNNGWYIIRTATVNGGSPAINAFPSTLSTFTDSAGVLWVAKSTVASGQWFRAMDVLKARVYNATHNFNWSNTGANASFDTVQLDKMGISGTMPTSSFTVPVAGIWRYTFRGQYTSGAASQTLNVEVDVNGAAETNQIMIATAASQGIGPVVTCIVQNVAGDTITFKGTSSAAAPAATIGKQANWYSAEYLGTG